MRRRAQGKMAGASPNSHALFTYRLPEERATFLARKADDYVYFDIFDDRLLMPDFQAAGEMTPSAR